MDKEKLSKKLSNAEDKLLVSKMLDKAYKSESTGTLVWSDFLDPHQTRVIEKALMNERRINYTFNGGYEGAERVVIVFSPNFISPDEIDASKLFKVINVNAIGRDKLTHRDYLGSLMGLGIKRDKIGDILVKEDTCSIIVLNEIAEFIKYNLLKVGNAKVKTDLADIRELQVPEPRVKEIRTTVASLRLDSVASAGFGISRSKMTDLIKAEKVNLNWDTAVTPDKQVCEGDTISVRGKGRLVLEEVGSITKKGRIGILLKKYI